MIPLGLALLVLSTFFLGWHFHQSRKPAGLGPLITSNITFMSVSWLVAVVAGIAAAILIGMGAGLLWGILGVAGVLVLPLPMSLIHVAIDLSIRKRMARKLNRDL